MVQNCLLLGIKCFLEENYPNLFIIYNENQFLGCKYHQDDKYFIFFISNYLGKITLSYRKNINKLKKEREFIEDLSIEEIKRKISLILDVIKVNEFSKPKNTLKASISDIDELEQALNKESVKKQFGHISLMELAVSFRLYNVCMNNNITDVAAFLLTPLSQFYKFKNLGKQTFKEVLIKKNEIIDDNFLTNIHLKDSGDKEKLSDIYYHPDDMNLKLEFTEDEYDNYIDFGIELGTITLEVLKDILSYKELEIFKMRMNITDDVKGTLSYIGNYFNLSRERIRQILNKIMYKVKRPQYGLQNQYIKLFNTIENKDILNYILIGIENIYNTFLLEFVLTVIDDKITTVLIDRMNAAYNKAKKERNNQFVQYHVEEKLYNIINFPSNVNNSAKEIFNLLHKERDTFDFNNNGVEKLSKFDKEVDYESALEKNIIKSYSKCNFVTNIKTQSLVIDYTYKNKTYQYYPDIQILINDKVLAIIEVKPAYYMVDSFNLAKYDALKSYCTQNGFGYAMVDDHLNSIETIKRIDVEKKIVDSFIEYVKRNGYINYWQFKNFRIIYKLKTVDLEKIILDNQNILEYKIKPSFKVTYIGE